MSLTNKILACSLACGMALVSANVAQAYEGTSKEDGVIFRIENIKPIADEEGLTSQCEFYVTVYNRLDRNIKEAELVLSWTDNVAGKYKIENGNLEVERDGEKAKSVITHTVLMKEIAPHQQKSFKETVDTNKCFLLFDRVDYQVPTCIAEGDDIKIKNNKRIGNGSCTGSFDYVNSQNPEYYSEFKDVPESDLEKLAEEQKRQDSEALEELYKQSLEAVDEVAKTLGNIK